MLQRRGIHASRVIDAALHPATASGAAGGGEPDGDGALDTLAYARRLREAGFSEQQAEGQAQALAAAMTDTLATKQDLNELAAASRQDVRDLGARTDAGFAEVYARMDARFAAVDARFQLLETRLEETEKRMVIRLVELEKRTEIRLAELAAQLRGEMREMEHRLTIRLGGIMVASVTVTSAIVSAMVRLA